MLRVGGARWDFARNQQCRTEGYRRKRKSPPKAGRFADVAIKVWLRG